MGRLTIFDFLEGEEGWTQLTLGFQNFVGGEGGGPFPILQVPLN